MYAVTVGHAKRCSQCYNANNVHNVDGINAHAISESQSPLCKL